MSFKKAFAILFVTIILFIVLIVGYATINIVYQEKLLRKEIESLSKLDITKDKFNEKYVCHGDFKKVEMAIKDYLNDYSNNLQNINSIVSDDEFKKLLSYENLSTDSEYSKSIKYVKDNKKTFNDSIDKLIDMSGESNIRNNISKYNLSEYYVSLYNELIFDDSIKSKLNLSVDYLNKYKESINVKFDTCLEIFEFLNNNKDNVLYDNGELKLQNRDLANQYNALIEKVK